MLIGKVVGNVVSTVKQSRLQGGKLLIVQPLDLNGKPKGETIIAVDAFNAGIGDKVILVLEGKAASSVIGIEQAPVEAACVGIVDQIEIYGNK
jgi:ethanolamine utilization protein EutN